MCDYSLAHLPNRLAVAGEELVVHRFNSGTLGLAPAHSGLKQDSSATSTPAVCVPPGARLLLQDIPERLQEALNVGPVEKVTFVEQSAEAFRHRDAVRFGNGREILLQHLECGQGGRVLSLETAEREQTRQEARQIAAPPREVRRFL